MFGKIKKRFVSVAKYSELNEKCLTVMAQLAASNSRRKTEIHERDLWRRQAVKNEERYNYLYDKNNTLKRRHLENKQELEQKVNIINAFPAKLQAEREKVSNSCKSMIADRDFEIRAYGIIIEKHIGKKYAIGKVENTGAPPPVMFGKVEYPYVMPEPGSFEYLKSPMNIKINEYYSVEDFLKGAPWRVSKGIMELMTGPFRQNLRKDWRAVMSIMDSQLLELTYVGQGTIDQLNKMIDLYRKKQTSMDKHYESISQ